MFMPGVTKNPTYTLFVWLCLWWAITISLANHRTILHKHQRMMLIPFKMMKFTYTEHKQKRNSSKIPIPLYRTSNTNGWIHLETPMDGYIQRHLHRKYSNIILESSNRESKVENNYPQSIYLSIYLSIHPYTIRIC